MVVTSASALLAASTTEGDSNFLIPNATFIAELAERIVGESLDDDARQRRIVDRFLDDLGSRPTEDAR